MSALERGALLSRRRMVSLMGASLGLAGLTSCRRPLEHIVPSVLANEDLVPGRPMHYTTCVSMLGTAFGLLIETRDGRPIKVEGNPRHPESLGATNAWLQAMILDLYDPDRSRGPQERGKPTDWKEATAMLRATGERLRASRGSSLAVVTSDHRSPTLSSVLQRLRAEMPKATVLRYEPLDRSSALSGTELLFRRPLDTVLDYSKAERVIVFDGDPLATEGSPVKAARAWAQARGRENGGASAVRLYAFEAALSLTGAVADHRFACRSSRIGAVLCCFVWRLARALRAPLTSVLEEALAIVSAPVWADPSWRARIEVIAHDCADHRGSSLVVVGNRQSPEAHALSTLANLMLDNLGTTVGFRKPFDDLPSGPKPLAQLTHSLESGRIDTLLILGGNPVFDAPADIAFGQALGRTPTSIHVAEFVNETSAQVTWHLNRAHPFESWSDAVTENGLASIAQPLVDPLWAGRTEAEVVSALLGDERPAYELVRGTWLGDSPPPAKEQRWRQALLDGIVSSDATATDPPEPLEPDLARLAQSLHALGDTAVEVPAGYELVFAPDSHTYDGRFANNAWLQELPDPFTRLTWGNAACLSPQAALRLGVVDGDLVALSNAAGISLRAPAAVVPGIEDHTIVLTLGQGRRVGGRAALGAGVDAYRLRTATSTVSVDVTVRKTRAREALARTQEHFSMEGRPLALDEHASSSARLPVHSSALADRSEPTLLLDGGAPRRARWAMTIDLAKCIGCGACVVACQAENNIPVVGIDGVRRGRAMHWLRVDRYFTNQGTIAQPVLCQHCERAPCESVCPVGATMHGPGGLNEMVYNRCVGTRYCANNCPFKVRRFNYFEYWVNLADCQRLVLNPEVTIRTRGVMEKCTFCVQRIRRAELDARRRSASAHPPIPDGTIKPACEQACPSGAIVFGDLDDPSSRVSEQSRLPRAYRLLEELDLRPRVRYLARAGNPNPELDS